MTDREAFERVMKLMGMEVSKTKIVDGHEIVKYADTKLPLRNFTTIGYDEFYSGAIYAQNGEIVMGYIDSHIAYCSDFRRIIGAKLDA